jgi:Fe-S cluster biogenesis protein NfuA
MSETKNDMNLIIRVQATPNPNAWKFVMNKPVLNEGKMTYSSIEEAKPSLLASALFQIEGVRQIHFFQNVITVTHTFDAEIDRLQEEVKAVITTRLPMHDPRVTIVDEKKILRQGLSPELQQIEEILDETVRPGLQGDGGDIEIIKFEENRLYVMYQGACGTCPSSSTGTLLAIEGILRERFNPQIEVIPMME